MQSDDHDLASGAKSYIRLDALRWAESQRDLKSGIARTLLLFLARKSDKYGCCWYAQRTLEGEIGFRMRAIRTHLRALERAGLIRTIRRSRGGMRASNVYHIIGWPDRERLPSSGHPRAGRYIVEDLSSLLKLMEKRHDMPLEAASDAALNNVSKYKLTTNAEKRAVFDLCLQRLGTWGTVKNRRALSRASDTLDELLQRYDLHRHVLPAIDDLVQARKRIPVLNTWLYFADPVARRAEKDAEKVGRGGLASEKAAQGKNCERIDSNESGKQNLNVDVFRTVVAQKRVNYDGGDL